MAHVRDASDECGAGAAQLHLNVEQAAKFLCVKPSTLYAWVHQRRIPYRKHGRRLVFCRVELETWSAKHAIPSRES